MKFNFRAYRGVMKLIAEVIILGLASIGLVTTLFIAVMFITS